MDKLPKHPDYQGAEAVVRYYLPHSGQVSAEFPLNTTLPAASDLQFMARCLADLHGCICSVWADDYVQRSVVQVFCFEGGSCCPRT